MSGSFSLAPSLSRYLSADIAGGKPDSIPLAICETVDGRNDKGQSPWCGWFPDFPNRKRFRK